VLTVPGFAHAALRWERAFDLVLANILPDPLVALAPSFRRAIAHGGVAILSGLLDSQVRQVEATYRAHGFRVLRRTRRDGWSALALVNTGS
jgi:ribosomal protein L11 methyltransferase